MAQRVESSPARPRPAIDLASRLRSLAPSPTTVLILLLLVALLARVIKLESPDRELIYDEQYYVNAARIILGWPTPTSALYAFRPAGIDPNQEHPPLGKVLIAGSMAVVGDNPYGWRLPSLLAGLASIALLYGIVRAAGGNTWLGVLAATFLAFDNLAFVHSRIGMLDMLMVAPMLLAASLYLTKQPLAAGIVCAVAALVKLTGVYSLLALLMFEAVRALWDWRDTGKVPRGRLRTAALLVGGFLPAWFGGLWLLDLAVTSFRTPWQHLGYMLDYGISLGSPSGPVRAQSFPWQWLVNEGQIPYLLKSEQVATPFERIIEQVQVNNQAIGVSRPIVYFRGAMNPIIIAAAIPALCYAAWRAWKFRDLLSLWAVTWIAGVYLPFYPLSMIQQRQTYIFYFLPALAAVAVAVAQLLKESGPPRVVLWGFLLAVLVGFIAYFPFRTLI